MNDSTPAALPPQPPRDHVEIANGAAPSARGRTLRGSSNGGASLPDPASQSRDRAAESRDAHAQDRDEAAEFRDRAAEKRDARLVHDLLALDDGDQIARTAAPSTLDQEAPTGEERRADHDPEAVDEELGVGRDGTHARETRGRDGSDHEHESAPRVVDATPHDDEQALLEDVLLIAREDRLDAARDRERADGDRREGARERATALQDRNESALAERRAVQTLESMSDAFFTLDAEWRFTYLNPQSEAILERSREHLIGKSLWEELPWGFGLRFDDEYRRVLRDQTPVRFEACYEPLGRLLEVRIFPVADGLAVYFSDVTTERQQEQRLRQAQRLEAIGQATAGVAHDFGNILAAVRGFAQLGQRASGSEKAAHYFSEIDRAGAKAAQLTRQLLAFARQQDLTPTVIDLNDVVGDLSSVLAQLVAPGVDLRLALSPEPIAVFVDRSQLEQVLINLVVNSNDAIDTIGTITITTSNSDPKHVAHEPGPPSGWLQVNDDGSGIPTDVMPHIFDPFFSTKPQQTGTGLGLATIYGVISQSGGSITVESTPGAGTTMTVALPAPAADPAQQATTAAGRSSS